jgi:hypothetical protein
MQIYKLTLITYANKYKLTLYADARAARRRSRVSRDSSFHVRDYVYLEDAGKD